MLTSARKYTKTYILDTYVRARKCEHVSVGVLFEHCAERVRVCIRANGVWGEEILCTDICTIACPTATDCWEKKTMRTEIKPSYFVVHLVLLLF